MVHCTMHKIQGPIILLVSTVIAQYLLSDLPGKLWKFILDNEIMRSALLYPLSTSFETLLLYGIFQVIDYFMADRRLKGIINSHNDKQTYLEAWKVGVKNIFYLSMFMFLITIIMTGDIHGNFTIQGIESSKFPSQAPTFWRFLFEIFIIILCTDFFLYWLHRIHHILPLYKRWHSVHHAFHEPIAAHATAVHVIELFSVAPIIFLVPRLLYEIFELHPLAVYFAPHLVAFHGVLEHCGYDDYIEYLTFGFLTGSKMHFVHHQVSKSNYGFYTYFWDWLFGTNLSYECMLKRSKTKANPSEPLVTQVAT